MSLKQKTVSGLLWSFIDQFANMGITFIAGIILARLLSPREFGLIGMITVFIAVSESFINSGFSSALIRKKNCTDVDFSTVFYFNLLAGILFFTILFFSAQPIAAFFNEPQLKAIVQVLGAILIIDSLTLIQRTILTKRIDFKLQARISIIASLGSGIIAISMAYSGYGVWSLVAQRLSKQAFNSLLLWLWNKWRPLLVFSTQSFKELFGFGGKLLVSGLIDTLYRNIYYLVIGKFFSAQDLGYYTRANEFNKIPSQNLNAIIGRVTYPILSSIQDDKHRLKRNYQKLIRSTMLITFTLMIGMAAIAKPMILTLIGDKWEPSIIYLQMLCFVGMMYPLHALNLNMLQVSGRSDLFLKLEVIKKIIAIPTIIIGVIWGIKIMIVGMMINTLLAYYLNSYWSGRFIGYSFKEQILDILPSFGLALTMGIGVFFLGEILPFSNSLVLISQIITGAGFILIFCEITKFRDYIFIKELVTEKFNKKNNDR
ncbi:MAG: MOP flippase family protein [Bacteroidales bacterium]